MGGGGGRISKGRVMGGVEYLRGGGIFSEGGVDSGRAR